MQRQSLLGSPVSKLHSHGGAAVAMAREDAPTSEDPKRRDSFSASSPLSNYEIGEDHKTAKLRRLSSSSSSSRSSSRPEKFVHIIPVITLMCFLILYLCSHSPTQMDLAGFNGFKRIEDTNKIMDSLGQLSELEASDVIAIRSPRNLHEIRKRSSRFQLGREVGDF
ncbi:hypothetical protein SAY86_001570 [Trapa natans]|uniref:Uncharacterized protein n=1 Tax=Trapa natans TaxID=22666 RepID=A0AAN7MDS5_TRANT|nr:hypothetical protein SAY86_001570 [Trapa natans]